MFTKKLSNQFTASLLSAVSGVLNEAKKCKDCDCAKCECDDAEEVDEATSLSDTLKRERAGKEKKEPNGVKCEEVEELEEATKSKLMAAKAKWVAYPTASNEQAYKAAKEAHKKAAALTSEEVEDLDEKRGLWDNIHAKRERIKSGSGERMRKPGSKGAPSATDLKASQTEEVEIDEVAPSGPKYERMVKHIKKAYAKDGKLTGKEKGIAYATAWKAKNEEASQTNEAFEQIDELSKDTLGSYVKKATNQAFNKGFAGGANLSRGQEHEKEGERQVNKAVKRVIGVNKAVNKLTKEESEQIDELSKGTMGRYVNKAADRMSTQGVTAGLKIAADEKSKKNFDTIAKRQKGIATAVSKLTKEEQDFIDALNDVDMEQIDELSVKTLDQYRSKARKDIIDTDDNNDNRINKRAKGYMDASKQVQKKLAKEEVELDEARGRPRKAGAKEFTINPRTKEKLMHDNPEHMKKIEALQRNGVIPVPKTEAGQHVVNQLTKAKLSMRGGETINFTHGEPHHVSGEHAAKLLTRYAGMKPDEKEAFQKKIGHSHASLKSEL